MTVTILEARNIVKEFSTRSGSFFNFGHRVFRAVDDVSFTISAAETLGLVGESGCGKSTLARTVLFLEQPTSGEILFRGEALTSERIQNLRRQAQIVFQDPYSSLPPRMKAGEIIGDALRIHGLRDKHSLNERVAELLADVGLKPDAAQMYPHELSGGQRQRVGIARALAVEPSLIIADESVSSLDVSVQAQILNLFRDLQEKRHLAYLFVSHNLGVVKYMSHRIAVMYLGKIVELAPAHELHHQPLHPYTRVLLSAIPSINTKSSQPVILQGEPPDPTNPPPGCKFHPRCPIAQAICSQETPLLKEWLPGHQAACHFALEAAGQQAAIHHIPSKEISS